MKTIRTIAIVCALLSTFTGFAAGTDVQFDPTVRYSEVVINSCLYHFHANTKPAGFAKYDAQGNEIDTTESKRGFDYVPGLVAKAVLEAVDLYQTQDFAKPWYYAIRAYAEKYYNTSHTGGSLDDLNACKMYFQLAELTKTGAAFADATTFAHCNTAITHTKAGLADHNANYSISATHSTYPITNAAALPAPGGTTCDVTGGWWHKSSYPNQLWLDGQYMGPALLAQVVANGEYITTSTEADWDLICKQFDITWTYLWNDQEKLLYHAFCADGGTNTTSKSNTWEGLSNTPGSECYHSAEFWGRAEGWYVLALVDVLEQMDKAGIDNTDPRYVRLLSYLQQTAQGLLARQDSASGCWYQLLAHDGNFSVTDYKDKNGTTIATGTKQNYLEASASAIFTSFFLKAIRLGYLDKASYEAAAKKAYEGLVNTFLKANTGDNNPYALVQSCKSAGLGGTDNPKTKIRTGSAAYYLHGYDVGITTNDTEGKILGAFILAAVEYERAYMPITTTPPPTPNGLGCCLMVSIEPNL